MLPPEPDQDRDPDRASWPHPQAQEANEQAPPLTPQGYGGFQRTGSYPSHLQMQQDTPLDSYASEEERTEQNADEEDDIVPDSDSLLDNDDFQDNDSALGQEDDMSSTASIMSGIMRFREENGRRYNGYGNRTYVLPNDEPEMDRLDFQHHLLSLTFDNQMTVCPIGKVHRVLDVGTGTGIWAIDFAEEHPEAVVCHSRVEYSKLCIYSNNVTFIDHWCDVSPIQPLYVPPNVVWEIDDLEKPWTFTQKFDFIHSRMMTGSFQDWSGFIGKCYENLHPGGWIEMIDVSFPNRSDDSTLSEDSAVSKWGRLMLEASINLGCPLNTAETYKDLLHSTGFIGVTERIYKWPQNRWPADKKHKEVGTWTLENFTSSLTGLSVALFTRGLGWTSQQLEIFLIDVRREMKDIRIHSYWPIYVVYAQKPRTVNV